MQRDISVFCARCIRVYIYVLYTKARQIPLHPPLPIHLGLYVEILIIFNFKNFNDILCRLYLDFLQNLEIDIFVGF